MRYLTLDPGTVNFAYTASSITYRKGNFRITVKESDFISCTIVNLTHKDGYKPTKKAKKTHPPFEVELGAFDTFVESLYDRHRPHVIGTERFQPRGHGGNLIECVGMMNGIILVKAQQRRLIKRLYMAATWKAWVNKIISLDMLYKIGKGRGLAAHTVDTVCMAIYLHATMNSITVTASNLRNAIRNTRLKHARP